MKFRLSEAAQFYAWRELARRAGCPPGAVERANGVVRIEGLPVHYSNHSAPAAVREASPAIFVEPCSPAAAAELVNRRPESLDWRPASEALPGGSESPPWSAVAPAARGAERLPVLFWGEGAADGARPLAERGPGGSVVFHVDLLATAVFMLSRWEEIEPRALDEHGRFPAAVSAASRQGFLDRPVVDEYALVLRDWLASLLPGWKAAGHRYRVKLSHDIDNLRDFRNLDHFLRTVGGDLLKRWSPIRSARDVVRGARQLFRPRETERYRAVRRLAELSRKHGFEGDAFYFLCADPGLRDGDYEIDAPPVRSLLGELRERGFEIGLHAGYDAADDPELLREQKARLDAVLGETDYGGRQHYLRFRAPQTWRHWDSVGLRYDASLGFADEEGFRCGTCHPYSVFDIVRDRELKLVEEPLVAMDVTLLQYRGLPADEVEERVATLASTCRSVEGVFTLLWHNASITSTGPGGLELYDRVLARLASL